MYAPYEAIHELGYKCTVYFSDFPLEDGVYSVILSIEKQGKARVFQRYKMSAEYLKQFTPPKIFSHISPRIHRMYEREYDRLRKKKKSIRAKCGIK